MTRRFSTDIDLLKFSLINAMLNPVASDPSGLGSGDAGRVWYNTATPTLKFWNGTTAIDLLARSTHTGSQTASTISDLATVVQAYSLSTFAAPTGDISLASHKLTNVTDPSGAQDAATKNYVDQSISGVTGGLILKGAVTCAATANISITSAPTTIDGITMTAGMVVLLTAQTTATQNGPYVWSSSGAAMARASNWSTSAQATLGSFWMVEQGTNADNLAVCTNDTAITIGTTTPTFAFRGSGATYTQGNGISISGGVVSAVADTGISVTGSGIAINTSVVGRKLVGSIPATTSAPFTVSGSTVTINHAFGNSAPLFVIRAGSVPVSGYTAGQLVEMDNIASDANNIQVTLPAAPVANNWVITIIG